MCESSRKVSNARADGILHTSATERRATRKPRTLTVRTKFGADQMFDVDHTDFLLTTTMSPESEDEGDEKRRQCRMSWKGSQVL